MIDRVLVSNHAHVDLGYTDHVPNLWRFFDDIIDRALDLIEASNDYPTEAQFKYTCEVTCIADHYLKHASSARADRFLACERAGRLDIGAMWANFTPLVNQELMRHSLEVATRLRAEYGLRMDTAMNCDINGLPAAWIDHMLDAGINGFSMAINETRGRSPERPRAFWWRGASGRRLLTWSGENYNWGLFHGIPNEPDKAVESFAGYIKGLEDEGYPYPFAYLQMTGELNWGDNNWPYEKLSHFVRDWNDAGNTPRFEIVTLSGFFDVLRNHVGETGATQDGDWSDWWSFGVGSMPRETALLRQTLAKLELCRRLTRQLPDQESAVHWQTLFDEAASLCLLYCEHTFSADEACECPDSSFTEGMLHKKAGYVYDAAAVAEEIYQRLSAALRRKAAASLEQAVVLNPHEQTVSSRVQISDRYARPTYRVTPPLCANDAARVAQSWHETPALTLAAGESTCVGLDAAQPVQWQDYRGDLILENERACLRLCALTGSVSQWVDLGGDPLLPLCDPGLNRYIYEDVSHTDGRAAVWRGYGEWRPDGWGEHGAPDVLRRRTVDRVLKTERAVVHKQVLLRLHLEAPGVDSLKITYRLDDDGHGVQIVNTLVLPADTAPRSIYFVFAPRLDQYTFWYDSAGIPRRPDQQIPGSCHDYASVGDWAAVSAAQKSVLIMNPDAPLIQFGGFQYLAMRTSPNAQFDNAWIVSWPVNNHWEVNFPVRQPGLLVLRYHLRIMDPQQSGQAFAEQAARRSRKLCWLPFVRWNH